MREGALTEREWRKQALRAPRREPRCWGAQCMVPQIDRMPPFRRRVRMYAAWTLGVVTLGIGGLFMLWYNTPKPEYPMVPALSASVENLPEQRSIRPNSAVAYVFTEVTTQEITFTREELLRGKMMLVNRDHPLPADAPGANTVCIAAYGKGIVPVRDLTIKSGQQTIDALYQLFFDARQKGVEGLAVWRGTLSEAEQRELQLDRVRAHASSMTLTEAVEMARAEVDDPRTSDLQQQYSVDIRLYTAWNGAADSSPLGLTQQGRYLMQNAWRHGFIRRYPRENSNPYKAYRFRYVGVAHSTVMTYLDLDLEAYLEVLHEKQAILVHENGTPRYLILCKPLPAEGCVNIPVPEGTTYEAGYDNLGCAVVACNFPA